MIYNTRVVTVENDVRNVYSKSFKSRSCLKNFIQALVEISDQNELDSVVDKLIFDKRLQVVNPETFTTTTVTMQIDKILSKPFFRRSHIAEHFSFAK